MQFPRQISAPEYLQYGRDITTLNGSPPSTFEEASITRDAAELHADLPAGLYGSLLYEFVLRHA